MKKRWQTKKTWQILLGLLVSGVALVAILRGISWDEFGREIVNANYWWVIPFVLLETLSLWARAMRWRVLLEEKMGVTRLFWLTSIGYHISNILPLRIGEVAKVYLATRDSEVSGMQAFSTVVLERMIDVVVVFLMLFAVLPLVPYRGNLTQVAYWAVFFAIAGMMGLFVIASKRVMTVGSIKRICGRIAPRFGSVVGEGVDQFLRSIERLGGLRITSALMWGLFVWLTAALAGYVLLLGFLPGESVYVGVFVTAIVALGIALPSVPGGVGLWEAATVAALAVFNVQREIALVYAVAMHLLIFVQMTVLGMIGLYHEGENINHLAKDAKRFVYVLKNDRDTMV